MDAVRGVVFPQAGGEAARSTSALGRAVVGDALLRVDPIGARAANDETNWRHGYVGHFRRLIEAGLTSPDSARRIATDGLASLHERMRYVRRDGVEIGVADVFTDRADSVAGGRGGGDRADRAPADRAIVDSAAGGAAAENGGVRAGTAGVGGALRGGELAMVTVAGAGAVDRELSLPYHGERLRGDALARQLDAWTAAGVIEPSCAEAVRDVAANPAWLDLTDQRIIVLGAGAEMGPVQSLLRWGAGVIAVDLPRPAVWSRLLEVNARYGGRLSAPVPAGSGSGADGLAERAGADLLHDLPEVADWLLGIDGRLVLGNYVYADGATNVRVSMAVDALTAHVVAQRPDTALAFLATPTDVFAVPTDAVAHAGAAYRRRTAIARVRRPLRVLSAGRLLRRNYAPGADPGICDSLVPQQGPNYALAKRLQRWRAAVARAGGTAVSFKVAPPTRTRSVLKNRALAAAYAGAHLFDVEVFEPATSNTLMAVLLVHDLRAGVPAAMHPWQDEAHAAAHGGLWRAPYAPRSALGLAAVLGFGGARA